MRLQLLTWPAVAEYLERSTGILVPIGSTEQHGPNGLVGTDAICPETLAWSAGERDDILVAPTLAIGMAQHHLGFPGSITLRPATLLAMITDIVESLARTGFTHLYFVNGHGGNIATLYSAFSAVHAEASLAGQVSPLRLRLGNWFDGPRVRALSQRLFGAADGSHATASEVSLSWFAHPQARREVRMTPEVAPSGGFHDAADYRRRYPDGRIGSNPALASVEAGAQLHAAGVDDLVADYRAFLASD